MLSLTQPEIRNGVGGYAAAGAAISINMPSSTRMFHFDFIIVYLHPSLFGFLLCLTSVGQTRKLYHIPFASIILRSQIIALDSIKVMLHKPYGLTGAYENRDVAQTQFQAYMGLRVDF